MKSLRCCCKFSGCFSIAAALGRVRAGLGAAWAWPSGTGQGWDGLVHVLSSKISWRISRGGEAGGTSGHAGWRNRSRSLIWRSKWPSSHASGGKPALRVRCRRRMRLPTLHSCQGFFSPGLTPESSSWPPALTGSGGNVIARRPLRPLKLRVWGGTSGRDGERRKRLRFVSLRSAVGSGCAGALAAAGAGLGSSVLEVLHRLWCGEGLQSSGNVALGAHQPFNTAWSKSKKYVWRKQVNLTGSRSRGGNLGRFRYNQIMLEKGKKEITFCELSCSDFVGDQRA